MPSDDEAWLARVRATLERYDDSLLRIAATKLCRPRNQWPVAELIDRSLATLQNPAVVDRRLKELPAESRRVLAVLRHSRQTDWPVAGLCEIGAMLGGGFTHEAVCDLIQSGLVFPEIVASTRGKIKVLANWLAQTPLPTVFTPATVTDRTEGDPVNIPASFDPVLNVGPIHEVDGLEWQLRLAVFHQLVQSAPLRRTQSREFFKRDLDRLRGDALLGGGLGDALAELPDADLLVVSLALATGVATEDDGEIRAGRFPASWSAGLGPALADLWASLFHVDHWNSSTGFNVAENASRPHASAWLVAAVLLGQLPADQWTDPRQVETWIAEHHPYWSAQKKTDAGIRPFLLGVAYPMRMIQAAKTADGNWAVRLSPLGRWILGIDAAPPATAPFPQTLLTQPNLEILVYRQGLTSELIPRLGAFATWKTLGAACTLQLEPNSVYRALEGGETLDSITRTLDRHGMKPTPVPVLDALRTWANKRDRITVYPTAALLEFASPADLNEALSRGIPAIRLTDRLAVVPREEDIDYKHFRLTSTRDYCLPPERCVDVEADGVTLVVDLSRSDLLLETELARFAEPTTRVAQPGRKIYKVTPSSMRQARQNAMSWPLLAGWFAQRTGLPGSPAARLLFTAAEVGPMEMRQSIVLHVPDAETADGLMQWPSTQHLIAARLGPMALAVLEANVEPLSVVLRDLGVPIRYEG